MEEEDAQVGEEDAQADMGWAVDAVEPLMATGCVLAYGLYHVLLWRRYRQDPLSTNFGHNREGRLRWCFFVMAERRELIAVQTIRNTIMAASFMATTSLTLSAVVAAYLVNTIKEDGLQGLDMFASAWVHPMHKFFAIILSFSTSFYCFMQSVRASDHASYLINVTLQDGTPPPAPRAPGSRLDAPRYVANVLDNGANYQAIGTRLLYLEFLFVVWLFGPVPFATVTILAIPHLWRTDRAPCEHLFDEPIASTPLVCTIKGGPPPTAVVIDALPDAPHTQRTAAC